MNKFLTWAIAVCGFLGAVGPAAGYLPGKPGIIIATLSAIAQAINRSVVNQKPAV